MTDWLDRLQPGDLPFFSRTHAVLSGFAPRRDQVAAREIAQEILADPLATLHTLHTINERVGERYGTEVTTVEHALMMQGIGAYLDAIRPLPRLENTPAGRDPRALKAIHTLARRSQHAAWQARDFAVLHADIHAEEVQVAAQLFFAPEILLWLRAPAQARELDRLRRREGDEAAEEKVLGMPLAALRASILENWRIPPLTRDLLSEEHRERARQSIIAACVDIARRSERGWWDQLLLADYVALAETENTPLDLVVATVHANAARVARSCDWLPVAPAAAWMPMLPGEWPPEEDDEAAVPAATTVEAGTQSDPAPPEPAPAAPPATANPEIPMKPTASEAESASHTTCPMPDKQVFRETLKGIEAHLDGSLTLNQMSAVILKGLHSGLGLSRILFAMVTPAGDRVKCRFTLGIPADDPLRHFEFDPSGKDLFAQLMGKMQGVWVNEGNRQKLWPMIDARLQKLIGSGDFYAMSLHIGDKPAGMIYADRGHGECGLDPLTYTDFKMLCIQAARGLGKVKPPA